MRKFNRQDCGRIYVQTQRQVKVVLDTITEIDEFEAFYIPEGLVTTISKFPETVFIGKFDNLDLNNLAVECAKKGVMIFPYVAEAGHTYKPYTEETSKNIHKYVHSYTDPNEFVNCPEFEEIFKGYAITELTRAQRTYTHLSSIKFIEGFIQPTDPAKNYGKAAKVWALYKCDDGLKIIKEVTGISSITNQPLRAVVFNRDEKFFEITDKTFDKQTQRQIAIDENVIVTS